MQLMIAAAPPLRQMACGAQLPIANAAYRIENGVLCALPMPPALRGGAMLLTGAAGWALSYSARYLSVSSTSLG